MRQGNTPRQRQAKSCCYALLVKKTYARLVERSIAYLERERGPTLEDCKALDLVARVAVSPKLTAQRAASLDTGGLPVHRRRISSSFVNYLRRRLQPKPPPKTMKSTIMRMIHPVVLMAPPSRQRTWANGTRPNPMMGVCHRAIMLGGPGRDPLTSPVSGIRADGA